MEITIDTSIIDAFMQLPPDQQLMRMILTVGWLPVAVIFLYGMLLIWVDAIQNRWGGKQKYIFLAIDIPKSNSQSLLAVENMFTYFGGAHGTLNLIETYWEGKFQLGFSFEIVSIDGYTQFLIRSPEQFRNLTESAFYSQYPDAEITEINDYTEGIPSQFPNEEWDIWGVEFIPTRNHMFPIKTYEKFEHQMGEPETTFRDPMASLMDLCSTLRKGEQLWWQLLVYPTGYDWMAEGEKQIGKILKEKIKSNNDIIGGMSTGLFNLLSGSVNLLTYLWNPTAAEAKKEEKNEDPLKMISLKPQDKKRVEAVQEKIGKLGFECKNRFIYVAKKEVMNKNKVVNGFIGFMKQFMDLDVNNLKPDLTVTGTRANYLFKEAIILHRKRKIMRAYKGRDGTIGRRRYILNIAELATLWHFPVEAVVKAPLIQKAPGRKSEPPMTLPIMEELAGEELLVSEENIDDIFKDEDSLSAKKRKEQNNRDNRAVKVESEENIFGKEAMEKVDFGEIKHEEAPVKEKGEPPANLPFA